MKVSGFRCLGFAVRGRPHGAHHASIQESAHPGHAVYIQGLVASFGIRLEAA